MREIKYKAKRLDNSEWVEGFYGVNGKGTDMESHVIMVSTLGGEAVSYFYFTDVIVKPETVGQFTGLQDRVKVEIYEHDEIENPFGKKGIVVWFQGGFKMKVIGKNNTIQYDTLDEGFCSNKTVIGSIHDKQP